MAAPLICIPPLGRSPRRDSVLGHEIAMAERWLRLSSACGSLADCQSICHTLYMYTGLVRGPMCVCGPRVCADLQRVNQQAAVGIDPCELLCLLWSSERGRSGWRSCPKYLWAGRVARRVEWLVNRPDPGVVRSGFMSGNRNRSEWEQVRIETGCFLLVDTLTLD